VSSAPFAPVHKRSTELDKPVPEPAGAWRALVRLTAERGKLGSRSGFRESIPNNVLSEVDVPVHELLPVPIQVLLP